ncbi:hypothetical protein C8J56DRAFT_879721 [Mycena floridula]|nr:hypothetical protein C8J56DRAFT_879721 [Mycena floridula]
MIVYGGRLPGLVKSAYMGLARQHRPAWVIGGELAMESRPLLGNSQNAFWTGLMMIEDSDTNFTGRLIFSVLEASGQLPSKGYNCKEHEKIQRCKDRSAQLPQCLGRAVRGNLWRWSSLFLSTPMIMTIGALCLVAFPSSGLTISAPDIWGLETVNLSWRANSTDPSEFVLWWGGFGDSGRLESLTVGRNGMASGQESIDALFGPGTQTVFAKTGDDQRSNGASGPTSTRSSGENKITSRTTVRTSSTSAGGPDNGSSNLPMTARKNILGRLVGGILGGCICLGLISLWIFRKLCLRKRQLNLIATPYDAAPPDLPIRMPDFVASKPRLTSPGEINTTEPAVAEKPAVEHDDIAEIVPTEGQQSLQAPVAENDQQLDNSEAMLDNVPDASPGLTRALIMENTRLQRENQAFRDLHRSDWAFGLADVPPPSYPHSPTST